MSNPMSYVPYAIASTKRSVSGHAARALVAAGSTLLQRCAPLVRALAAASPASLLPPGPAFVTALGASDGHALLALDPSEEAGLITQLLRGSKIGVVFTIRDFASYVPTNTVCVLLDGVPKSATVQLSRTDVRVIDLGSHVGLAIEGESGAAGSDEPMLRWYADGEVHVASHREVMSGEAGGWAGDFIRKLLTGPEQAAKAGDV